MRLLHVLATDQRRGAEVFAADLVRSLNRDKVDQQVAILRNGSLESLHFDAPTLKLEAERNQLPGLNVSFPSVKRLRGAVHSFQPDVIQAHGGESLKYCALAKVQKQSRLVHRGIGLVHPKVKSGPARAVNRRFLSRAEKTIAIAESVRTEILELFDLPPSSVITIPNGVDPSRMTSTQPRERIRESLGIGPGPVLTSVAALTWEKDPHSHIEVSRRLAEKVPGLVHLIVGDGPLRRELEQVIARDTSGREIRLLGSRKDMGDLLLASDALLFASRMDGMEGMPTILIEAGMAGVPAVAFDVAGVAEVIVNGKTGWRVPWGDFEGVVDHLSLLMTDEPSRKHMAAAARDHCLRSFNISVIAPRYLKLYSELLAS